MRKSLLSLAVLSLAALSACATQRAAQAPEASAPASAESCSMPAKDAAASAQPVVAPGEAKIGDRTTCPVSKETFVVSADSPKAEYAGKTYYFCCPHCAARFQEDPAKFAQAE